MDNKTVSKVNKISKIAKIENPEEMLTRYIDTIDVAIKAMIELQTEIIDSREAWRNAANSS